MMIKVFVFKIGDIKDPNATYVDGKDENLSNWMRWVNSPRCKFQLISLELFHHLIFAIFVNFVIFYDFCLSYNFCDFLLLDFSQKYLDSFKTIFQMLLFIIFLEIKIFAILNTKNAASS